MKLVCPKCQARSSVPDERVPADGAWGVCPKCAERFFIRPAGDPIPGPETAPRSSPAGRSPEAQKLLDRLRAQRSAEAAPPDEPGWDLEVVTLFPDPEAHYPTYLLGLTLAGLGLLITAVLLVYSAQSRPRETAQPRTAFIPAPYGMDALRDDLLTLRQETVIRNKFERLIEESGRESRMFKYFLANLAPGSCQEITSLTLWSKRPVEGFQAQGLCLSGTGRTTELSVRWQGRSAVATMGNEPGQIEVLLSPRIAPATKRPVHRDAEADSPAKTREDEE